jgi:outer membrane protein assembly factor BamB
VYAQDWPQWRGPLGQGVTSASNLPPAAGSDSLKVLWKTPIPGEGCSSPIVSQGRAYVTTAYAGSQPHAWDAFTSIASVLLAVCVLALALLHSGAILKMQTSSFWSVVRTAWTIVVIALCVIVLARPRWFWQFTDSWTGTTVAAAEIPWVESLHLRPVLVLIFGSLLMIFVCLGTSKPSQAMDESDSNARQSPRTRWLNLVTLTVTIACSVLLGLIGWQPGWFFDASEPCLAWLVAGGLGLLALAASIGWLGACRKTRLLLAGVGLAVGGWLYCSIPVDEFGDPLSLQNRIAYLVPAAALLVGQAWASREAIEAGRQASEKLAPRWFAPRPWCVAPLLMLLGGIVFVRANYLQPQSGVVRAVVCVDAATGAMLWNTPIYVAPAEKKHSLNSHATPTPACDGERVYAYFGSGLAALDTAGRVLWLKRDPDFAGFIRYGAGSSVVLAGDKIIIYRDSEFVGHGDHLDDDFQSQSARRPSALIAVDSKTGAPVWSVTPPFSHDSYMTPLVWTRDNQLEVVIATWKTLAGVSVRDGATLWTHSYPMQQIVPSPAVNGDCLIVTGGHVVPAPIVAVQAPASSEKAQTVWSNRIGGGTVVSPVCWGGYLFSVSHIGVLTCRDASSGQVHWTMRLGSRCLASLTAGDGKVYAVDQEGTLHVFAADATGTLLATLSLDESCAATPAIAANVLFVRTSGHVCCIGSGEPHLHPEARRP